MAYDYSAHTWSKPELQAFARRLADATTIEQRQAILAEFNPDGYAQHPQTMELMQLCREA